MQAEPGLKMWLTFLKGIRCGIIPTEAITTCTSVLKETHDEARLRAIFDRAKFIVKCTDIHGSGHVVFCIAWDEGELARDILAGVQLETGAGKVVQL